MANIVKTYTFVNSQPADGTQVNKNFDDVIAGVGDLATLRPTIASLGLDADITTLVLPANTTISAAGAALVDDATATAQLTTLGVTAAAKTILDDATVAAMLATLGGLPLAGGVMTGSLKVGTGFGCNGSAVQTAYASGGALTALGVEQGINAFGSDSSAGYSALLALVNKMQAALVANGIMS